MADHGQVRPWRPDVGIESQRRGIERFDPKAQRSTNCFSQRHATPHPNVPSVKIPPDRHASRKKSGPIFVGRPRRQPCLAADSADRPIFEWFRQTCKLYQTLSKSADMPIFESFCCARVAPGLRRVDISIARRADTPMKTGRLSSVAPRLSSGGSELSSGLIFDPGTFLRRP